MSPSLTDHFHFHDTDLEKRYRGKKMPIALLHDAYFDGRVDLKTDMYEFLAVRDEYTVNKITKDHFKFAVTKMLPEVASHSQAQDQRIAREHYDRGNDFFEFFLGDRMVYTSAFYKNLEETLEQAQDNKMDLVCQKLHMKPGERHLDIGSGWGTLVMHAAKHYGVDSTGVTIAQEQTAYATDVIAKNEVSDSARILCIDYRDIPDQKWDKISCLEMAEHVGVKNFQKFMRQVYGMLEDDGLFYLQIAGPKRGGRQENTSFGLFMNKYVFPGADASRVLPWVAEQLERANFEIHSVENVGIHYSHTLHAWYDNWHAHKAQVLDKYGEYWFRVWDFFLAWATHVANEGQSTCWQLVCNKNNRDYDRNAYIGKVSLGERDLADLRPDLKMAGK